MDAPPRSFPGPGVRSMPTVRHGCSAVVYVAVRNSGCEPKLFKDRSTACRSLTGVRQMEQAMSMNRDQVKGRIKEAKGKIKEAAGKLVGNEKLEQKGKAQKILGEAQAKFGDVKTDVKEAVKKA